MTRSEIQIVAKLIKTIVQTEINKSNKKLISEIATLKKNKASLTESIPATSEIRPHVQRNNTNTPTLDFIREMVGMPMQTEFVGNDDSDLPPNEFEDNQTQMFVKDYTKILDKINESSKKRNNLQ